MSTPPSPALYVVSTRKLYTLFFVTLGLYPVYWSYKNWRLHKDATQVDVYPVMRGLFFLFFVNQLLEIVEKRLKGSHKEYLGNPQVIATIILALGAAVIAMDRMSAEGYGLPWTDWLPFAVLPLMAVAMAKAQTLINLSCDDPEGATNSAFTRWNWTWIVLGGLCWALALIGLT